MSTLSLPQLHGAGLLTNSRMSTARTCLKKHYFAYELGWRPEGDAKALRMGSNCHKGTELHSKGETPETAISVATRRYSRDDFDQAIEAEQIACLLNGYFWYWGEQNLETVAVELQFELPIRSPDTGKALRIFNVGGKIDRIVRLADGRLAVLETKTTGDSIAPDSDYWRRLDLDQQISLYMLAARELGHDVQTVLYDVIRKPSIEPCQVPIRDEQGFKIVVDEATGERVFNYKKNGDIDKPRESANAEKGWKLTTRTETPEEYGVRLAADIGERPEFYFARREIPRIDADLEEFRWELVQQAQAIREAQKSNRWYRNSNACTLMGRCPYLDICKIARDATTPPSGFVQLTHCHPELQGDAA